MKQTINALLINPWITDFAAYNLWAEPLGLLYVASVLRDAGAQISFIDCLFSSVDENPRPKRNGCSKYKRSIIDKPDCLQFVPREYARYGISDEEMQTRLAEIHRPDVVLISSMMTYWYPGIAMAIEHVHEAFGRDVPIILGGIYTMLCAEHAARLAAASLAGAKHAATIRIYGSDNLLSLFTIIEGLTGVSFEVHPHSLSFDHYPLPAHELAPHRQFFSIMTSKGCPFDCSYCASHQIHTKLVQRNPHAVLEELHSNRAKLATHNVAFYDDALLLHADNHILPILKAVAEENIKLAMHLPNGIHARYVTEDVAHWFRVSGVETIRIGLETADPVLQERTGDKAHNDEYRRAVGLFRAAGYSRKEVGTYIMVGLPGQSPQSVENSLALVGESGAAPHLSYFSPIPGTNIWEEALRSTTLPAHEEPLFQNNSVFILKNPHFTVETISHLKEMAIDLRTQR
jgi:radical SAM superfamily enzyme YgiQ (UPF0313 family)